MLMLNKSLASTKIAHKVIELWWWNILMSWTLDLWEQDQQQFTQMGKLSMSEKNHKSLWTLISQSIKWKQFCNANKSLMFSGNTYRMCYYDYNLLSHYYTKDLVLHFFSLYNILWLNSILQNRKNFVPVIVNLTRAQKLLGICFCYVTELLKNFRVFCPHIPILSLRTQHDDIAYFLFCISSGW